MNTDVLSVFICVDVVPNSEAELAQLDRPPFADRLLCGCADSDGERAIESADHGRRAVANRLEEAEMLVVRRTVMRASVADCGIELEAAALALAAVTSTE